MTRIAAGTLCAAVLGTIIGCGRSLAGGGQQEFKGKIAKKYEDSEEWWPKSPKPPEGAPNVLILLLDDVGFAQLSPQFGGLINTPTIDRLVGVSMGILARKAITVAAEATLKHEPLLTSCPDLIRVSRS